METLKELRDKEIENLKKIKKTKEITELERGPAGEDGIIIEINLKGNQDLNTEEEDGVNPNV